MDQPCVLIVDDEPAFLRMVAMAVRALGYAPATAPDAESALELLEEIEPSVALIDVHLPEMDGLELTRRVKARAKLAALPVLLMSGYGRPQALVGDGFLAKPFHIDELARALAPHVARS